MDDDRDFCSFLHSLDAQMGAQNRQIILFVDNCAAHPKDTPFLTNVRVVRYPANCTSTLQPLDLGIIHSLKAYYSHLAVAQFLAKFDAVALLQSFRHFPCNGKSTRALHTTSLKCCLPATDAIDRREKIHACALRFKVGSCKRARL